LVRQPVWLYSKLCLDKRMQALEQLQQAQPWVVLSEEEEPEEGFRRGGWSEEGAGHNSWLKLINEIEILVCKVTVVENES